MNLMSVNSRRRRGRPKGLPKPKILIIRCTEETWRAFRRYAVDYENYEAALRTLLVKADVLKESRVF